MRLCIPAAWLIAFAIALPGCVCGPNFVVPEPDSCDAPAESGVQSLEIGGHNENLFEPWSDGAVVQLTIGAQGGEMLGVRFRATGAAVPACAVHETVLTQYIPGDTCGSGAQVLAHSDAPLRTYNDDDTASTTQVLWLILSGRAPRPGESVSLQTTLAGITERRDLWVDETGTGADASCVQPIGGDCQCPGTLELCESTETGCDFGLLCVIGLCTLECAGPTDDSCPAGSSCQQATDSSSTSLGYFCLPAPS